MNLKAIVIIFKGLLLKQIKQIFFGRWESVSNFWKTNISSPPWYAHAPELVSLFNKVADPQASNIAACAHQGGRNVSFSENSAYVLYGWSQTHKK